MLENFTQLSPDKQHMIEAFAPLPAGHHTDPLLAARGQRYGAFVDNARVSQLFKDLLRAEPGWGRLDPDMRECFDMVVHKMSRIICGDPHYDDSWVDIAGYATRVADRLKK